MGVLGEIEGVIRATQRTLEVADMNQVLGTTCGNALEVHEALAFLRGDAREPRLLAVTRMLSAELLLIGGRRQASDAVDHRVGLTDMIKVGRRVEAEPVLSPALIERIVAVETPAPAP